MSAPGYLAYWVMADSLAMIAATLFTLSRALRGPDWPSDRRASILQASAILLVGWFAAAVLLAWIGVYDGGPNRLPTIQFGILIPIAIGGFLIWRSTAVSAIIDAVPQHWLVGLHVFRALGAVFLVLFAAGRMPALFAVPAGIGDLAVTALAPLVAYASARDPRRSAGLVLAWNILGIADFVVAAGAGLATGPSPLQVAAFDNPNTLIASFPLVLIPVYLVPLWTLLHIASLTKLRRARSQASPPPGAAATPV